MKYTPGARRISALYLEYKKKNKPPQFTKEGFEKLKTEFADLTSQRPDAVSTLKRARELGDLSENGFYKASRAKLSFIDSRLRHLSHLIKTGVIIETQQGDIVSVGSCVVLQNGEERKEYMIVGAFEANPSEGRISDVSPLGKSLLGKKVNDQVEIFAPKGKQVYTVVKII